MKFSFYTLGCKVNQYETNALKEVVLEKGYELSDEKPDIFIINTCTVTAVSDKKNLKLIRRVKKDNPEAVIAVCGCFAQISPEKLECAEIDVICGTDDRIHVIDYCIESFTSKTKHKKLKDSKTLTKFEVLPASVNNGRTRGLIKIQDGCNSFCTYCIIPYARGRSRSMGVPDILSQVETLSQSGVLEITITGIEISSYGKDINENLLDLLVNICSNYPKIRFRLGSLEPRVITDEFCATLCKFENLCPHFHLSLQSGSDFILKRMGRKYDTNFFFSVCELLRKYFTKPAITTDLIVGFPGETDVEYNQTLEFIEKCNFASMHIFPYSIREGTVASKFDDQISTEIKNIRVAKATEISNLMELEYLKSFIGESVDIVFEERKNEFISGHSKYNFVVCTKSYSYEKGENATIIPTELKGGTLYA